MKIKKIVLNVLLTITNVFVNFKKIKNNQIAFISLEANYLDSDMLLIYDEIIKNSTYKIKTVLIQYDKKTLINNFLYMLNCIRQIWVINTSHVVIIRDNNYVISNFKRDGVKVIQVWHACGAIKKFGNVIKREYPINNYDFVLSNSDYWQEPYSQAFNVQPDQVISTGLPRVDHLLNADYINKTRNVMTKKYPLIKEKKVVLYAPTFRGNIYNGFTAIDFDAQQLLNNLGDDYIIMYKYHPLLKTTIETDNPRIINANSEDTHDLFCIADVLISDFSSIIFDYSLLNKPMHFYVPDLDAYLEGLGCFVDYSKMPGGICKDIKSLSDVILSEQKYDIDGFKNTFFKNLDGRNNQRVVELIDKIIKAEA